MPSTLTPSPAAIATAAAMIRVFEGCKLHPYFDPYGNCWSIAYGFCALSDGTPVTAKTPAMSQAEADRQLMAKLQHDYVPATTRALTNIPLPDNAWAALIDFAWNLGPGRIAGLLLSALHSGDMAGAAADLGQYVHAGGVVLPVLVTRRRAEGLMLTGAAGWPGAYTKATRVPAPVAPSDDGTAALNDAELARVHGPAES